MSSLDTQYEFRDGMVSYLSDDLIGPAQGADEVIETTDDGTLELPLDRYIMGILWPNDDDPTEIPDAPDGVTVNDSETVIDDPVPQALLRYPTSMGLTFAIDLSRAAEVQIAATAARYVPEGEATHVRSRARQQTNSSWRRDVPEIQPLTVDATQPGVRKPEVAPGLELFVLIRPARRGVVTITAALRNLQSAKAGSRDAAAWFQVGITVTTAAAALIDRTPELPHATTDPDLESNALLYREVRSFATGHGCAADWSIAGPSRYTDVINTTFLPSSELRRAQAVGSNLSMKFLAESPAHDIAAALTTMLEDYRGWIEERLFQAGQMDGTLKETALRHVSDATTAANRIEAGIRCLSEDETSMRAFRLSNEAMYLQRNRQDWIRNGASGEPTFTDQSWRPFQIAFILINLPGLADRSHKDRDLADLLWFPTGGGKTEAYLGLIAFTIFHRRLFDPVASGVAVIMRYTLRLLTVQQFERASMLMCSLETIRRKPGADLGNRQFSIGLWVGQGSTPNSLDVASSSLNKLRKGDPLESSNPVQLTRCPWCNNRLDASDNYRVERRPERHLHIACRNPHCFFTDGLPVHVVDEDLYRERPELLIGTVDKFARMAWDEHVGNLFGSDGKGSKPDLIIQDELHLISGPLGSVVGLYEAAIDIACEDGDPNKPTRAKVIASTATIRRAQSQVRAIFNRGVAQFPPPGLEPDSSFFASVAGRNVLGTRLYVGAMAPGTSHSTLMIRIYAALIHAANFLPGDDVTRDPYWTLMGYFNSLRVLGSAYLQVSDDVGARLKLLARRDGVDPRDVGEPSELTSRVASSEIPHRLKSLEAALGNSDGDPVQNVVLATNMISVGLDVDRLGLMAVMGQPQSSAEYIQATSRVGRKFPGLVVAVYNAARSRDRSHYESFLPFHQALYRAVESASATPFSARARDRALHGAFVSAARLTIAGLRAKGSAAHITDHVDAAYAISDRIIARIDNEETAEEVEQSERQLVGLITEWLEAADDNNGLKYSEYKKVDGVLLYDASDAMKSGMELAGAVVPWPTLQSMRDVDVESVIYPIKRTSDR